jgi:hypothetical protein
MLGLPHENHRHPRARKRRRGGLRNKMNAQPKWLLLPPFVRDRLSEKTGSDGLLPPNLVEPILERYAQAPERTAELFAMAGRIHEHLNSAEAGWGGWPTDIGECLYIGLILGFWIEQDIPELLLGLAPEELAWLDDHCIARGLSCEQFVIEQILQAKETGNDLLEYGQS